jgi:Flp pilus assembly protein TadG
MLRLVDRVRARLNDDGGNAIVEFSFLAVTVIVPLVYVVLSVFEVQRAAYAVTNAAREGGRVFTTAPSADDGRARAETAVDLALRDAGLVAGDPQISCSEDPCFTPGGTVTVVVRQYVSLPFVPSRIFGHTTAGITVSATHIEAVEAFRSEQP